MSDDKTTKKIPFARPYFGPEGFVKDTSEMILDLMNGGQISNGEICRKLEENVARISGADFGISCCNCTQAMMIMLATSTANKVATAAIPSFTWKSTLIAINAQKFEEGARLTDIDRDSWCTKHYPMLSKPGIALAVDTFGNDSNPTSDIPLFFDRAHSLGVKFSQIGVASAISLSPSKIITGCEGGIVLTNKERYVRPIQEARDATARLSEVHALIANRGLSVLGTVMDWKTETYYKYKTAFPQFQFQECRNTNHQVIGMLFDTKAQRDMVMNKCPDIEFKAYYMPMHVQFGITDPNLSVTDDIYRRILCLPSWYKVDREYVIRRIKEALET